MKKGLYKITPANGKINVYTYKSGSLSLLSHDLLIDVCEFTMDFDFNENESKNRVELQIKTDSFKVDCVVLGDKRYEKLLTDKDKKEIADNIKKRDILNARRFPYINFESTSLKEEDNKLLLSGDLKIKDCTKNIDVILTKEENTDISDCVLKGKFRIMQTDFGIKPYSAMFGTLGIQNHVDIAWTINIKD